MVVVVVVVVVVVGAEHVQSVRCLGWAVDKVERRERVGEGLVVTSMS